MDADELRNKYPEQIREIEQQAVEDYITNERREVTHFSFYRTYWLAALAMPKAAQAAFVMGILSYAFTGIEPALDKTAEATFIGIRPNIDNSVDSVLFGKQGGRPRKSRPDDNHDHDDEIDEIVAYLNDKTKKTFRAKTAETRRAIIARLNEGYTVEDFKRVVDNMTSAWIDDEKMRTYLRPSTLFGPKMDAYLNDTPAQPRGGGDYGKYR